MKFVDILVEQTAGNSDDLDRCILEFEIRRSGNCFFSCDASDQQMIDQIVGHCEEFIEEHRPHFDWCEMRVLVGDPYELED
tara:strand:+ start:353 stop:595 length:243 start_codon:yes stop_codon:yes gene_type:complete